ncbi:MAG: TatD family hydrolase [Cyanobacteria bacterium MAG IRC4_bin_6]|nr:TatD family hydrolase [Cyanobacteria bacterium MAG IRC4_bin_6]
MAEVGAPPLIASPLVDSHCHVVFADFQEDLDTVARRWREQGVCALVHACVTPEEIPAIRQLADRFPELRYAVGLHPLEAGRWREAMPNLFLEACRQDKRVVAVGELGLDLYKATNVEQQVHALEAQLDVAWEVDLPVIIHCRDAAMLLRDILVARRQAGRPVRGVMHCWAGTPQEMDWFLDLGLIISFSGIVTFKNAKSVHACAQQVLENRYMVETDCPFLAPTPHRGQRNEPAFVAHVAEAVAALRHCSVARVRQVSSQTAASLFGLESLVREPPLMQRNVLATPVPAPNSADV